MLLYFMTIACTSMDNPGAPFKPTEMIQERSEAPDVQDDMEKEEENPPEEIEDEFRSKEEVLVTGAEETQEPVEEVAPLTEAEETPKQDDAVSDTIPIEEAEPSQLQPAGAQAAPATNWGWPIRVVKTDMSLMPPRAILGFPDGSEVVVQSGHMLPQHNLVVMSIGAKVVGFAKIHSQCDHAKVETVELMSQN